MKDDISISCKDLYIEPLFENKRNTLINKVLCLIKTD